MKIILTDQCKFMDAFLNIFYEDLNRVYSCKSYIKINTQNLQKVIYPHYIRVY